MYLRHVKIKNYSIHRDTAIDLSPITVLVGPNGSGKSALFDALLNFSMLARGRLSEAFGAYPYSFAATRHRSVTKMARIGYDIELSPDPASNTSVRYTIDYSQVEKGSDQSLPKFEIYKETLELDGNVLFDREDPDGSALQAALSSLSGDVGILGAVRRADLDGRGETLPPVIITLAKEISRLNKFRLDPSVLRAPSTLPDLTAADAPRIAYTGENVAGTLYYLEQTGSSTFDEIIKGVKDALPDFECFEFNTVGTQRIGFSMRFGDARGNIPAPRLSDGQLLVVGLMVLLHGPGRPPVLMIEEPENGLTATVQTAVYHAIRKLAAGDGSNRSQVLVSSHSPFVLCEAWNGEDREFIHQVKIHGGRAMVRRFSEAISAQGVQLRKVDGKRLDLGLRDAAELMSGSKM